MERQFLSILLFGLIFISGCQTSIEAISYDNTQSINEIEEPKEAPIEQELIEELPKNVWQYIIANSSSYEDVIINEQTLIFMNTHIKDVDKFSDYLNKSYYFIYYVIQEFEAANLPVELALIPFIESNYDPFSISPSGAVGLWQFMPKTGKLYNLEKSWWNEDRHDPFRSTHAAIGYFKYLFERFDNDIYLALAAYNCRTNLS